MEKPCKTCLKVKPLVCYGKHKSMADGLRKSCKECRIVERKQYRDTNKEVISEYGKKYYIEHKEYITTKRRDYEYRRYYTDIQFYLHSCMSARLRSGIKNKSKSTQLYIGCSYDFLTSYLETLFEEGMNWDNRGSMWEIDHIIPVSAWDLTNDFESKCCWNYRNLKPLFKSENRRKSNKFSVEDKEIFIHLMKTMSE
jgi:hypothetical protein